jgi:predicted nucleic acid-binding Zn ribbon protein
LSVSEPLAKEYAARVNRVIVRRRRPRNPEPESVASLLPMVVARLGGNGRALEQRVFGAWPMAVGDLLRRKTRPEALRGKTLIVRVDSSALAHELSQLRAQVLTQLGLHLGPGIVEELRTRVGPLD